MKAETYITCSLAALIALLPAVVAADSGGVLPWTEWALGIAAAVVFAVAICISLATGGVRSLHAHPLIIVFLSITFLSAAQLIPLPISLLSLIASGSSEAYVTATETLAMNPADRGILNANGRVGTYAVSIAPWLTKETTSLFAIISVITAASSLVFVTRNRVTTLLVCLAAAGAIQAGFGLYQILADSSATVWGIKSIYGGNPFGSYINRNNAALLLNIGLAAGVGLIAWRLAAISGSTINGDVFPFRELLDIVFDRVAMIGIGCSLLCAAGLVSCGSRGGIVGALAGFLMAFGIVQSLHRGKNIASTLLFIAVMAAVMLVKFQLPATSLERLQETPDTVLTESGFQDGRWDHWKDGWRAAMTQPILGWGAGTYRYAYLGSQETSAQSWFVNADNLWLEWFVEMGVVGVLMVCVAVYLFVLSLRNLNSSPDPIDHGLSTAGWFSLGAIAASQFFDFGLRIPANSVATALIVGSVVGRSTAVGIFSDNQLRNRPLRRPTDDNRARTDRKTLISTILTGPVVLFLCFVLLIAAVQFLSHEANADHLRRLARTLPRGPQFNLEIAEDIQDKLANHLERHPDDYGSQLQLSKLLVDTGRFQAAKENLGDSTEPDWLAEYRQLATYILRKVWYQNQPFDLAKTTDLTASQNSLAVVPPLFPTSDDQNETASLLDTIDDNQELRESRKRFGRTLASARLKAVIGLLYCPCSPEIHATLVRLDFAGGTPAQSEKLIYRLIDLSSRNSKSLFLAGELASDARLWETAKLAWQKAMRIYPWITSSILQSINQDGPLTAGELMTENPVAVSIIATKELAKASPNRSLLARAAEILLRDLPEDRAEKVNRLMLVGSIYAKRDQHNLASENYIKVISLMPSNLDARYQSAVALRAAGKLVEARQQARAGRRIAPKDIRFEQLLAAMSE